MEGETEYWQVKSIWLDALGLDKGHGITVGGLIYFDKEEEERCILLSLVVDL